jgi:glutamine synthetase
VTKHGTEACAYLLAVDTEMNTVDGYDLASWDNGYGDFMLEPDMATLRVLPWQPGTALVLADVMALDSGGPVRVPEAPGAAGRLAELPPPVTGNAYALTGLPRVPAALDEALALWQSSALAAEAFGADVVRHYATTARVELEAYRSAVTDWELRRYFERI